MGARHVGRCCAARHGACGAAAQGPTASSRVTAARMATRSSLIARNACPGVSAAAWFIRNHSPFCMFQSSMFDSVFSSVVDKT